MLKDNPYSKMIEMMNKRGNQVTGMEVGQVISPSPLTIKIGDLQIGKGDMFVADYLLANYKREITLPTTSATGQTSSASAHSHSINTVGINKGEVTFLATLKKGDLLAVYPINNNQKYIILARLVRI